MSKYVYTWCFKYCDQEGTVINVRQTDDYQQAMSYYDDAKFFPVPKRAGVFGMVYEMYIRGEHTTENDVGKQYEYWDKFE